MTTIPRAYQAPSPAAGHGDLRVTGRRVLAAEWIKLRTLRSTWWLLAAAVLSIVAAGVSPALTLHLGGDGADTGATDPTGGALSGVSFTQMIVAALGVVLVTSEYGTSLIRATLAAVPTRLPVLWGKAVAVAAAVLAATATAVVATFLTARAVLAAADVSISITTPGVFRALIGSALLLAVTGVLGVGFGWLVRSTAGGLAAVFGFLFVLPVVGLLVPAVSPYLPSNAGAAVMQTGSVAGSLPPWLGLGLFGVHTAVVLAAGALVLRRRDA